MDFIRWLDGIRLQGCHCVTVRCSGISAERDRERDGSCRLLSRVILFYRKTNMEMAMPNAPVDEFMKPVRFRIGAGKEVARMTVLCFLSLQGKW